MEFGLASLSEHQARQRHHRPRLIQGRSIQTHESLFTSGAYVQSFQPESERNPFAADYELKKAAVIGSVPGANRVVLDLGGGMGRMSIPLSAHL
jgi:hypothetical protein